MPRNMSGLTLIEVLIALAIIAISLTAVIKAASQNIRATSYLQNKTIALWVAQNVMNEVQLGLLKVSDERDAEAGKTEMLGQKWYFRATEQATGNVSIKKIEVKVYSHDPEDDDAPALIDIEGYGYHAA